jgi:hypothetical protein
MREDTTLVAHLSDQKHTLGVYLVNASNSVIASSRSARDRSRVPFPSMMSPAHMHRTEANHEGEGVSVNARVCANDRV